MGCQHFLSKIGDFPRTPKHEKARVLDEVRTFLEIMQKSDSTIVGNFYFFQVFLFLNENSNSRCTYWPNFVETSGI